MATTISHVYANKLLMAGRYRTHDDVPTPTTRRTLATLKSLPHRSSKCPQKAPFKIGQLEKVNRPGRGNIEIYLGRADVKIQFAGSTLSQTALYMQVLFVSLGIWF
jgi:hypothetical protein